MSDKSALDAINEWHRKASMDTRHPIVRKLRCRDGFEVSVQASRYHYCEPEADRAWPYSRWELGFPTKHEECIRTYRDGEEGSVYAYVPTSNVLLLIEKHGGIAEPSNG